jgi:hypothetical protein
MTTAKDKAFIARLNWVRMMDGLVDKKIETLKRYWEGKGYTVTSFALECGRSCVPFTVWSEYGEGIEGKVFFSAFVGWTSQRNGLPVFRVDQNGGDLKGWYRQIRDDACYHATKHADSDFLREECEDE